LIYILHPSLSLMLYFSSNENLHLSETAINDNLRINGKGEDNSTNDTYVYISFSGTYIPEIFSQQAYINMFLTFSRRMLAEAWPLSSYQQKYWKLVSVRPTHYYFYCCYYCVYFYFNSSFHVKSIKYF
jgi:hypothetical protein